MNTHLIARSLLRWHGILLIALGVGNAVASYLATKWPLPGPFFFLSHDPFPEVGFLQAYLLAALVGVTLLLGSRIERFYVFDLVGLAMHTIPPLTLILMWSQIEQRMGSGVIALSISIHSVFILWESIALYCYVRGGHRATAA
jgi:hypothetical protein